MDIIIYFFVVIVLTLIITPRVFGRRAYQGPAVQAGRMPCASSGGACFEETLLDQSLERNGWTREATRAVIISTAQPQEHPGILVENWPVRQKKE